MRFAPILLLLCAAALSAQSISTPDTPQRFHGLCVGSGWVAACRSQSAPTDAEPGRWTIDLQGYRYPLPYRGYVTGRAAALPEGAMRVEMRGVITFTFYPMDQELRDWLQQASNTPHPHPEGRRQYCILSLGDNSTTMVLQESR